MGRNFFIFKNPTGYYTSSIVQSWVQIYAGSKIKSFVILGGFLASSAFAVYSSVNYIQKSNNYSSLPRGSAQSIFDAKYNDKVNAG